jgi:hypothetical protein
VRWLRRHLGDGRFWQRFWLAWAGIWACNIPFAVTVWKRSLEYLIFISVMALVLACLAAFQASLGMRKTDPTDPL